MTRTAPVQGKAAKWRSAWVTGCAGGRRLAQPGEEGGRRILPDAPGETGLAAPVPLSHPIAVAAAGRPAAEWIAPLGAVQLLEQSGLFPER